MQPKHNILMQKKYNNLSENFGPHKNEEFILEE